MTVHLFNAAVMPQAGFYELRDIKHDFAATENKKAFLMPL